MQDMPVMPKAGAAPMQPEAPIAAATLAPDAAEAPANDAGLPAAALKVPALQAVYAGSPPAFSASLKAKLPELSALAKEREKLMATGIGFYKSLSGDLGVVFNSLHLHPETLKQADAAGKLLEVAPPLEMVTEMLTKNPGSHPAMTAEVPQAWPTAPTPTPMQSANMPMNPPPASVQNRIQSARQKNMVMGGPTAGPKPGAGRLMNKIMSPAV